MWGLVVQRRTILFASVLAAMAFQAVAGDRRDPKEDSEGAGPRSTDFVEQAETRLVLLDVVVTDKDGRPIRGLTKDDFSVSVDWRSWRLVSVDDFCDGAFEGGPADADTASIVGTGKRSETIENVDAGESLLEGRESAAAGEESHGSRDRVSEPRRFVLFFDYSQILSTGRSRTRQQALRWIREVMEVDDLVMVAAYATQAGLVDLAGFTSDKNVLSAAVERAYSEKSLLDPYPQEFFYDRCGCFPVFPGCPFVQNDPQNALGLASTQDFLCRTKARIEMRHGRRGLQAFESLLGALERVPGRKTLLLFHQQSAIFVNEAYGADEFTVGDHVRRLQEIGGLATLARTTVYPLFVGNLGSAHKDFAVNFSANLADYTGGEYNRSAADLSRVLDGAGRGFECVYRLGLALPEEPDGRAHAARVSVRGRLLPRSYRVIFLSAEERWQRRAQGVLVSPESNPEIPLAIAFTPVAFDGSRWQMAVELAFDLDSLDLLPDSRHRQRARWSAGAAIIRGEAREIWSLEAKSAMVRDTGGETTPPTILHRQVIDDLPPGEYRLTSFVADHEAEVFGGASLEIELPKPSERSTIGPFLRLAERETVLCPLPPTGEGDATQETNKQISLEAVPFDSKALVGEGSIEVSTWLCPGKRAAAAGRIARYLSREGRALFRFETKTDAEEQGCFEIRDEIPLGDTKRMGPGRYEYHLIWRGAEGEAPIHLVAPFDLGLAQP